MQLKIVVLAIQVALGWTYNLDAQPLFPGIVGSDPWVFRPNDPDYVNLWNFFSHLPPNLQQAPEEWDRLNGAGMHVDRAWQLHTGTPATVIAILDSGIRWSHPDLLQQVFLNQSELPRPIVDGTPSLIFDANGDGRFTVDDYSRDKRLRDANQNSVIDGEDLILCFSDGVDQDRNGYIDDIAGWDFHEHDNNPGDRNDFGHGTGEAVDSVAALNNGMGGAGACGNCRFMMLRVNDSFIVDGNSFAAAVNYATAMHVAVIQQALGGLNVNQAVHDAVEKSYDANILIVGSAADENSYHHNQPSTLDPIIYANAVRYNGKTPDQSSTFINFNNCSNYGPRVDVSVSGKSCSSEATGRLAGIAGLARSFARSLGLDLNVSQLTALIKQTATDIDREQVHQTRHQTFKGWDEISGYGRVHAWALLDRIRRQEIPPSLRLFSPKWFAPLRIDTNDALILEYTIKPFRSALKRLSIYARPGIQSNHGTEVLVRQIDEFKEGQRTSLSIPAEVLRNVMEGIRIDATPLQYRNALTLRIVVEDESGAFSEMRRTIFMHSDSDLHADYPLKIGASVEGGVSFVDLNHDGKDELVFADGGGSVHALNHRAQELEGFPVRLTTSAYSPHLTREVGEGVYAALSIADVNYDGNVEIIATTMEGSVVALDNNGKILRGFPMQLPRLDFSRSHKQSPLANGILASPVVVQIDGRDGLDIVVASLTGDVFAIDALRAEVIPGFPFRATLNGIDAKLLSSPAVGDLDGDGNVDLIFGSNHIDSLGGSIHAVSYDANQGIITKRAGFPARIPLLRHQILPTIGTGIPTAIAALVHNHDARLFVHGFVGKMYELNLKGQLKTSFTMTPSLAQEGRDSDMLPAFGHPLLFRWNHSVAVATPGIGKRALTNLLLGGIRYDYEHLFGAWGLDGNMLDGFPKLSPDMQLGISAIALDLDSDGSDEIISSSGGYFIRVMSSTLDFKDKFTGGWIVGSAAVGDIDGDGFYDLAAATREQVVFVWKTAFRVNRKAEYWPTTKANLQRTGVVYEN